MTILLVTGAAAIAALLGRKTSVAISQDASEAKEERYIVRVNRECDTHVANHRQMDLRASIIMLASVGLSGYLYQDRAVLSATFAVTAMCLTPFVVLTSALVLKARRHHLAPESEAEIRARLEQSELDTEVQRLQYLQTLTVRKFRYNNFSVGLLVLQAFIMAVGFIAGSL
jgi:hypothetical protein